MCPHFNIMTHLDKVVQFYAPADERTAHGSPVNGCTGAYFDICFDDNIAQMGNFLVYTCIRIGDKTEAVTANNCIGMDYAAIANDTIVQYAYTRMKYNIFPQTNIDANVNLIVQHTSRTHNCTFLYYAEAADCHLVPQCRSRVDTCFSSNATSLRGLCCLEPLQQCSESLTDIVNPNQGRFQWL